MHLTWLDWLIVVGSLVLCFAPALFFGRRAGKNTEDFFVSGRSVPLWLAGLSMVATTFASDTPLLVSDIVRRRGVAGDGRGGRSGSGFAAQRRNRYPDTSRTQASYNRDR